MSADALLEQTQEKYQRFLLVSVLKVIFCVNQTELSYTASKLNDDMKNWDINAGFYSLKLGMISSRSSFKSEKQQDSFYY